jgi:hypothetical protein
MLAELLVEEEEHADWLETQLDAELTRRQIGPGALYLAKAVCAGKYCRSGTIPGGRLGATFASNHAWPSSSESHVSTTRHPPLGLGPPEWEMKPLLERMSGIISPTIEA